MILTPDLAADKIGLTRVRERLAELTESEPTVRRIERLQTSSDIGRIRNQLQLVNELQGCLAFDDPIPLGAVSDVAPALDIARPEGAALPSEMILDLLDAERSARLIRSYLASRRDKYTSLFETWSGLSPDKSFEEAIESVYETDGRVKDSASSELKRIRKDLHRSHQSLRTRISATLAQAVSDGIAAEEQPTIRSGRMVIPVLSGSKGRISGFVHDVSATGQTVYIEPQDCLDLNNFIRELEVAERREIDEIRKKLTSLVRNRSGEIAANGELLIQFDLTLTCARFANEIGGEIPRLNEDGIVQIIDGRNPELLLLYRAQGRQDEVVPLDAELGRDFNTLVISGPNAGGKSVAMKSIGLLTAMLGLGIPVPVNPESSFCLFSKILVDIGDAQSLDDDLSTYSSHLTNLKEMLLSADDRTLILIDEIGTGTDPDEGSALARAILEMLTLKGARTVVTTHQGSLKVFADDADSVTNGSMTFDTDTLKPSFEFRLHSPGASYATEIASRVGIPDSVISRARDLVGTERVQLESLIASLEKSNHDLEAKLDQTEAVLAEAEQERKQLELRLSSLQQSRDEVQRRAVQEAEDVLNEANRLVEGVVREIRESQADAVRTKEARKRLDSAKDELAKKSARLDRRVQRRKDAGKADSDAPVPVNKSLGPLQEGDLVRLDAGNTTGEVISIKGDEISIAFGDLQTRVKRDRVTKVGEAAEQTVSVRQAVDMSLPSTELSARIDVRGMRVDEALSRVTSHLDAASAAMLSHVEILHGKGTGALRTAIQDYLSHMDAVSKIEEAEWNEGGAGVTKVFLVS